MIDVPDEEFGEDPGKGIELALRGDTIRRRHIATRATTKREVVVLVGDAEIEEFRGYSIGIDGHSLQMIEIPSGDVHTIALDYIVSVSDGRTYDELEGAERSAVDRRTASFRKTSENWLVKNWPNVYDRRGETGDQGVPVVRTQGRPVRQQLGPNVGHGSVTNSGLQNR